MHIWNLATCIVLVVRIFETSTQESMKHLLKELVTTKDHLCWDYSDSELGLFIHDTEKSVLRQRRQLNKRLKINNTLKRRTLRNEYNQISACDLSMQPRPMNTNYDNESPTAIFLDSVDFFASDEVPKIDMIDAREKQQTEALHHRVADRKYLACELLCTLWHPDYPVEHWFSEFSLRDAAAHSLNVQRLLCEYAVAFAYIEFIFSDMFGVHYLCERDIWSAFAFKWERMHV